MTISQAQISLSSRRDRLLAGLFFTAEPAKSAEFFKFSQRSLRSLRWTNTLTKRLHSLPAFQRQGANVFHDVLGHRFDQGFVVGVAAELQGFANRHNVWAAQVPGDHIRLAFERGWDAFAALLVQVNPDRHHRHATLQCQARHPAARSVEPVCRADQTLGKNRHRTARFQRFAGFFQALLSLPRRDADLLQFTHVRSQHRDGKDFGGDHHAHRAG